MRPVDDDLEGAHQSQGGRCDGEVKVALLLSIAFESRRSFIFQAFRYRCPLISIDL